jgi:thiamine-monophosphate kinase
MPGEFEYIQWLRTQTPTHPRVMIGPGDDCAAIRPPTRELLVTTDMLMDGTDFHLAEVGPRRVGRKAMAANLSDIAAMAGTPIAAAVSVALPHEGGQTLAEGLYLGLRDVADAFGVPVVGGDTNSWKGPLVISVTALGHHLDFTPRVREALALHAAVELHAMIDISDGLAADLNHICEESQCGAILVAEAIPISLPAVELSRTSGKSPLQHALGDGEDFELVFAVSPADGEKLLRSSPVSGLVKIGECVEKGLWIEEGGVRKPLEPTGWVHKLK